MIDYLLIQALNGLVIGVIYAVIAAGLTVIFSILKIVNFAHGEVYMMGGYFGYFAISLAGIPPLPAVLVAMALSFVLSVLVERTLLTPLYSPTTERKGDYGILITFGISIFLRALALIIYGPYPLRPPSFWPGVYVVGGLIMTWDRVFAGGAGVAMLIGLVWFMNRTAWGEALSAVSQSREVGSDRRHQRPALLHDGLWPRRSAGRRRRCTGGTNLLAVAVDGTAARHAGLRDRHPRRHGLGGRLDHRGADDRRFGIDVRGAVP